MRRVVVAVGAMLVFAAPARAASIDVSPRAFSPANGKLSISGGLLTPLRVGLQLATRDGKAVGWIRRPARRLALAAQWNGRLDGRRVPDGRYPVRLVRSGTVLAETPLRIDATAPVLADLRGDDGGRPFAGDRPLLTTITPNGDGYRDRAYVRFRLDEPATVTFQVARTTTAPAPIHTVTQELQRGTHAFTWSPTTPLNPRTYVTLLTATDAAGNTSEYGPKNAFVSKFRPTPVIRLQGIDASFGRQVYDPGQLARVRISTDAPSLTMRIFQSGPEREVVYADNQMAGVDVGFQPVELDWRAHRDEPFGVDVRIGNWPSGLYYVELRSADGRVGFAPFVVRPSALGASSRIAVVLPTNSWQAYNFYDENGDGWGDTWYAGPPNYTVDLIRPYNNKGVMPRFYRYDLPVLHWLYWTDKKVEFISDLDLDAMRSGDDLAKAYDLVIFEGHEEYVSEHQYDVVTRYRDLGGNLIFLSANNFFWRVSSTEDVLRKTGQYRQIGKPEARLIGVQYRGNDAGQKQGNFGVVNSAAAPWLWEGTGLTDGGTFGQAVGGYGIEIDATTPESPPGTVVLAEIPNLYGPGFTAQMSYYETPQGAKVFAAGALDFGGSALTSPVGRILQNLWDRLSQP
jgi:N,N-dimethylformamidase beta subunit-like, C-terminal